MKQLLVLIGLFSFVCSFAQEQRHYEFDHKIIYTIEGQDTFEMWVQKTGQAIYVDGEILSPALQMDLNGGIIDFSKGSMILMMNVGDEQITTEANLENLAEGNIEPAEGSTSIVFDSRLDDEIILGQPTPTYKMVMMENGELVDEHVVFSFDPSFNYDFDAVFNQLYYMGTGIKSYFEFLEGLIVKVSEEDDVLIELTALEPNQKILDFEVQLIQ